MPKVDWRTRTVALELLALSFRYPEYALVGAVMSGEWADASRELAQALGVVLPSEFTALDATADANGDSAEDGTALMHVMRQEATYLFVATPKPVVSPYEGVWRAKDDGVAPLLFVNPHSMAAERFFRACGLGQPAGTNEPLDHIATELELLQYLAGLEAGIVLEAHVGIWARRFASATKDSARIPFYRAAAMLLEAFLPALA